MNVPRMFTALVQTGWDWCQVRGRSRPELVPFPVSGVWLSVSLSHHFRDMTPVYSLDHVEAVFADL